MSWNAVRHSGIYLEYQGKVCFVLGLGSGEGVHDRKACSLSLHSGLSDVRSTYFRSLGRAALGSMLRSRTSCCPNANPASWHVQQHSCRSTAYVG